MGFDAVSNLLGEIKIIKLSEEISVILENATVTVRLDCNRCLKPLSTIIEIASSSREFRSAPPEDETDISDIFLVNMKDLSIDLTEMIRQEIILHFPLIPLCSKSCRGLCPTCGKNLNKTTCKCKQEKPGEYKPFKDLKKIISPK